MNNKILSLLFAGSLVLGACGGDKSDTEEVEEEELEEEGELEEEELEEEKRIAVIEKKVLDIIEEDFTKTEINKISINKNAGLNDGSYIVLPHLKWNVQNKEKMTRTMLENYSDIIAVKLAEESDVSEITVFWEVPYHREGENIAKFMYERVDESNQGIAKIDNWYDPIIR